jgi:transcriptional regulator with GAF, ATPase, and Fis domain
LPNIAVCDFKSTGRPAGLFSSGKVMAPSEDKEIQPDALLNRFLALASRPEIHIEDFLQIILEEASVLTESDAGGGIVLSDWTGINEAPSAWVERRQPIGDRSVSRTLLQKWLSLQRQTDPSASRHKSAREDSFFFPGATSSLHARIFDEVQTLGAIFLESFDPGHYGPVHERHLQILAAEAVPSIYRNILCDRLAERQMGEIIGTSTAFLKMQSQIRSAAAHERAPVLICGERGSGKELAAWSIHFWSERREQLLVPVLVSSFADSLSADELFGHEQHAFTGAAKRRVGKLAAAHKGTVFLDEIADLSPAVQAMLLRFLQSGEISRIGCDLPDRIDVRVISATNRDLLSMIAKGEFRNDLYERLNTLEIRVPPLRERRDDIVRLASRFMQKECTVRRRESRHMAPAECDACRQGYRVSCARSEFFEALEKYSWPGNVRELQSVVSRLLVEHTQEILEPDHLQDHILYCSQSDLRNQDPSQGDLSLKTFTRRHIKRILRIANHNVAKAAKLLDVPRSSLRSKMKNLGINLRRGSKSISKSGRVTEEAENKRVAHAEGRLPATASRKNSR